MNQILIPWCTRHTFYAAKRNYFAKWNSFIFALISLQNLDFDISDEDYKIFRIKIV